MEFVINEWYLDWHRPDAEPENQKMARSFLSWLQTSEHCIVVLRGSPFHRKLNDFRKNFSYHPMCQIYLKLFFSQIFQNPAKCRILETPPALPPEIEAVLNRPADPPLTNIESDRYLFESAESTEEKIIVTTDEKLILQFEGYTQVSLLNTNSFFSKFDIK